MGKTKIECRKCGKICEVETHKIRDVIDAICPKCSSEHIFIRDINLDDWTCSDQLWFKQLKPRLLHFLVFDWKTRYGRTAFFIPDGWYEAVLYKGY